LLQRGEVRAWVDVNGGKVEPLESFVMSHTMKISAFFMALSAKSFLVALSSASRT
jgi:hypothetical protein